MKFSPLPLQDASADIWHTKYRLQSKSGENIDHTVDDTYKRVALAISKVETKAKQKKVYEDFLWALQNGCVPAGRILSNAGAGDHKPATSTINCTVSGTISDSMDDILRGAHEAGLTLKAGCGIGYEFSTLRPCGAFVAGAGATTSGPLSFMDIFDKVCFTVSSAGGRRGAQMATFDVHHPDVLEFIRAKREDGRLRQFNCSLLITDDFMKAVKGDDDWQLSFPISAKEAKADKVDLTNTDEFLYREFPITDGYILDDKGHVACRIYQTVKARDIWHSVMKSTYDFAEPGFILIDKVNEMNNNWFCENIRATNPCGEQPLPPFGSCLLGSINLAKFVDMPFTDNASFDFEKFRKAIRIFTRMLDNVVDINGLPLPEQANEIITKRRHGMGILGLSSTLTLMKLKYGEEAAISFTDKVSKVLAMVGWEESLALATEKGAAPIMDQDFEITKAMLAKRPEMAADGIKEGDVLKGKVLWAKYSRYMQLIGKENPALINKLAATGGRFTHHSSIAPTGTISLSVSNNVSNGIEPSFAHKYARNIILEGKKTKEKVDVFSYELLAYRSVVNPNAEPYSKTPENALPDYFMDADNISTTAHVDMQAAAQKWIDSSISKTVNVPTDCAFEEFDNVYMYAYEKGLKGCTTFRFNPEAFQGVLVKEDDLANTTYEFTLSDGSKVECKGNEQIEYDGELHSAANLFDALKEGTYGKHSNSH